MQDLLLLSLLPLAWLTYRPLFSQQHTPSVPHSALRFPWLGLVCSSGTLHPRPMPASHLTALLHQKPGAHLTKLT